MIVLNPWFLIWIPVFCSLFAAKGIIHYFQLESYQFPGFFRTLTRNRRHAWLPGICVTVVSLLLCGVFWLLRGLPIAVLIILAIILTLIAAGAGSRIARFFQEKAVKKKLVYTGRLKRFYFMFILVMSLISWGIATLFGAAFAMLWPLVLPLVVALSGLLAWPLEKLITECYFQDARRKLLKNPNLIRIGITGSYGKTTVKHILGTILSEKYPTLITPASFNTPMGVSRAIRERLRPAHQIFVAEMGARHVGDIREMCRLVKPSIGILTSVGPQHLDTFKTVERVTKAKYELMQALPKGAPRYFFNDHGICEALFEKAESPKTMAGMDSGSGTVWCENISVSAQGSHFELHIAGKGSIECQTALLGEHNIQNILLAAAVASDLRLSLKQISHGIAKLVPVKSRLELMTTPGSFTIINDGFNSNPVGARAALKVLSAFPKRRIVITPGMVELGEEEAAFNRDFGRSIAECADIAIVIGKQRAIPILEGLREGGFTEEQIMQVSSFEESTEALRSIVKPVDTVLYENDLPENYQEA